MRAPLELRHQLVLGITGLSVTLVLLVRFVYLPVIGQIRERMATWHDLRVKLADAKGLLPKVPAQEVAFQQVKAKASALQIRLGNGQALARILDALRARAQDLNLEFSATQSPPEGAPGNVMSLGPGFALREVPLELTVSGRYRNLGEFLGTLHDAPFIAAVQSLSVKSLPEDHPQLEARVNLAIYLAKEPLGG